jgi:hypothetical protein
MVLLKLENNMCVVVCERCSKIYNEPVDKIVEVWIETDKFICDMCVNILNENDNENKLLNS